MAEANQPTDVTLSGGERLSRFLVQRNLFAPDSADLKVKHAAFMPYKGEVSVAHTQGLAEEAVWSLRSHIEDPTKGRTVKARADIQASHANALDLTVRKNGTPFAEHCNIVGFSSEDEKNRMTALELAKQATLFVLQK